MNLPKESIWHSLELMDIGPGVTRYECKHCSARVTNEYVSVTPGIEWPKSRTDPSNWIANHETWCKLQPAPVS